MAGTPSAISLFCAVDENAGLHFKKRPLLEALLCVFVDASSLFSACVHVKAYLK